MERVLSRLYVTRARECGKMVVSLGNRFLIAILSVSSAS